MFIKQIMSRICINQHSDKHNFKMLNRSWLKAISIECTFEINFGRTHFQLKIILDKRILIKKILDEQILDDQLMDESPSHLIKPNIT